MVTTRGGKITESNKPIPKRLYSRKKPVVVDPEPVVVDP